ncbi:MAG TPA: hypothetical protein VJX67_19110, partial [Blastocatellia bacterium]|nr:hypothetical protein [Blastocatellia bacterium]
ETALEREEAARVLYVAATRARDLLVVPALGDVRRDEGWLKAIYPAIYPAAAQASRPASATPNGCPEFGRESTPDRPDKVERPKDAIVPGLHQPERGNHKVVWWDPSILKLKVEDSIDLSRQTLVHRLLATDDGGNRSQESIRAHETWQKERTRVRTKSRHPSLDVATATELAGDTPIVTAATIASGTPIHTVAELVAGIDVRIESTRAHEPRAISDRPSGKRFGTLVHAILALVDLRGDRSAVEAIAKLQGKLLGATVAEVRAAVEAVVQTLDHGLIRRAAAAQIAGLCRRESPVAIVFEDGLMVEGVVDLTFREDEPGIGSVSSAGASDSCPERAAGAMSVTAGPIWTVVDFKTDVEISEKSEEEYKTQVRLYAQAISRATGQPARAVLLRV